MSETSRGRMLRCRVFGHAWEEVPIGKVIDSYVSPPGYREIVALQCLRCQAARIDSWNRWGVLGSRRYVYEDGYSELGHDLRDGTKPGESTFITAKKRYLQARRNAQTDEGSDPDISAAG